ncbi:MAG: ABC transporter permease subunit, partial [Geminicoccaceae bacterium]
MRKRAGLARALAANVLLMDEPSPPWTSRPWGKFKEGLPALIADQKKTFLLVSHSIEEAVYVSDRMLLPWVNMFLSASLADLVPVIMILFGYDQTAIILTVVLFAIWIIVLDACAGVRGISASLVEMARSYGASPGQAFFKVYLWAALPELLAGIRLGFNRAVKGVVIGRLLVSIVGFGPLFEIY